MKAYKFRIYPNIKQVELIQKTFGCCRYVYNYFLNRKIEFKKENKYLSYHQCSKELTILKSNIDWLKEPDKCSLQNSLRDLDVAFKNFYEKGYGFPKFKSKKNDKKTYRTNANIKFTNLYIQLPKVGKLYYRDSQIPSGRIINATLSQEATGNYYIALLCDDIVFEELPIVNKAIGIDLGIADFAIFSNGIKIGNPRFYESSETKLAKLQRSLSRKTIGSSNWNKTRTKVAKLHKHISEQRRDFLQKLTTKIVHEYDTICIEDLQVEKMKSKNSLRNKRLNDASWYEFRRQLIYKCNWYKRDIRIIDKYYPSSQICNACGNIDKKKDVSIRQWVCPICKSVLDRDINAAINILNYGLFN